MTKGVPFSVLLVFVVLFPHADSACVKTFQLGSSLNVSHTVDAIPDNGFQWLIKGRRSSSYFPTCTCNKSSLTCDGCLDGFQATIQQTQAGGYESVLTMNNVFRFYDQASVWWNTDTNHEPCTLQVSESTCARVEPVQRGSPLTIRHGFDDVPANGFQWRIKGRRSSSYFPACTCTRSLLTCDGCLDGFQATIQQTQGGGYESALTMSNVFMFYDQASVWWNTDTNHEPCTLQVSAPYKPTCAKPQVVDNTNVQVTCHVTSVYHGFKCHFRKKTGSGKQANAGSQQESSLESCTSHPTLNCVSVCRLDVHTVTLGAGSHTFRVVMEVNGHRGESDWTDALVLDEENETNIGTITGPVIGLLAIIIVVLTIFVLRMRGVLRKRNKPSGVFTLDLTKEPPAPSSSFDGIRTSKEPSPPYDEHDDDDAIPTAYVNEPSPYDEHDDDNDAIPTAYVNEPSPYDDDDDDDAIPTAYVNEPSPYVDIDSQDPAPERRLSRVDVLPKCWT